MKHTFTITVETEEPDRERVLNILNDMVRIAESDAAEFMEDVEDEPDIYNANLVCEADFVVS